MQVKITNSILLAHYGLFLVGLFSFLFGFFPLYHEGNVRDFGQQTIDNTLDNEAKIDKLVFLVIDALRYDFVLPNDNSEPMPFILSCQQRNQACLVTAKAHAPTVTMPRIKAITSGAVPNFIDVILNFDTTDFKQDTFIKQANMKNHKIVFYGDDTWLKLFPNMFIRYEGTTSFFVSDYTEVDHNVTRNLELELKRKDWTILVLHYLGLDHIGHLEGPRSSLVGPKLKEMDSIIEKISQYLKKLEVEDEVKSLFIVTGDHGMKDTGSHGGVTHEEITVPLLSIGKPCHLLPGWPDDSEHPPPQIDIASTLSIILGLPIPVSNMGKLIPSLLSGFEDEEILLQLQWNRNSLKQNKVHKSYVDHFLETDRMLKNWITQKSKNKTLTEEIASRLFRETSTLSEQIIRTSSEFNLPVMIMSSIVMWILFIVIFIVSLRHLPRPKSFVSFNLLVGTVCHTLSFTSSSFIEEEHQTWYFFWATHCVLVIWELTQSKAALNQISLFWFFALALHRIIRKLNQTGDKWSGFPDFEELLNSSNGQSYLIKFFILALAILFLCALCDKCSTIQLATYGTTLIVIFCYRLGSGNVQASAFDGYPNTRGIWEAKVFWVLLIIFFVQSLVHKTPLYLVWSLLAGMMLRPHNVILVPVEILVSKMLHKLFYQRGDDFWNGLAHVWLGHLFYFYQGNSNSLASIDVASGYIGMTTYNSAYALVMITSHTFSAHVLSFLLSPHSYLTFLLCRLLPVCVYCTLLLFQIHHLFIWSVFTPKLMYEAHLTLTMFVVMCMISSLKCT